MRLLLSLLYLSFCCGSLLFSQEQELKDDSITIDYALQKNKLEFQALPYASLDGFQHYRPFGNRRLPLARSGNLGLPFHSLSWKAQDWDIDYILGGYQGYMQSKDSMRFYKVSRPFTNLRYTNGAESEQIFDLLHTQNFGEGLNISFNYRRIVSEGFFLRQFTNHTQFNVTSNWQNRNGRWRSKLYYFINTLEAQENAGIFILPNEDPGDNTALLDVNMRNAQNRGRSRSFGYSNAYDIVKKDSSNTLLSVEHEISWSKVFRNYQDDFSNETAFYPDFYIDSLRSRDTSSVYQLTNAFWLRAFQNKMAIGLRDEQYEYNQNFLTEESLESQYAMLQFVDSIHGKPISFKAEKGLSGFHQDETEVHMRIGFGDVLGFELTANAFFDQKQPDFFLLQQRLNHYYNTFNFSTSDRLGFSVNAQNEEKHFKLTATINQIVGLIYFDSNSIAQQSREQINQFSLHLQKEFAFNPHWHLSNNLMFQQFSDEAILPLPQFLSFHSFYYENEFFKKSLKLQAGLDWYWISDYQGYAYDPSMAQFQLRGAGNALGNQGQLDLFLNLAINKSARIFIKMENILSNSFDEETYRIANYPIPGRALKYGLSWRMLN